MSAENSPSKLAQAQWRVDQVTAAIEHTNAAITPGGLSRCFPVDASLPLDEYRRQIFKSGELRLSFRSNLQNDVLPGLNEILKANISERNRKAQIEVAAKIDEWARQGILQTIFSREEIEMIERRVSTHTGKKPSTPPDVQTPKAQSGEFFPNPYHNLLPHADKISRNPQTQKGRVYDFVATHGSKEHGLPYEEIAKNALAQELEGGMRLEQAIAAVATYISGFRRRGDLKVEKNEGTERQALIYFEPIFVDGASPDPAPDPKKTTPGIGRENTKPKITVFRATREIELGGKRYGFRFGDQWEVFLRAAENPRENLQPQQLTRPGSTLKGMRAAETNFRNMLGRFEEDPRNPAIFKVSGGKNYPKYMLDAEVEFVEENDFRNV